MGWKGGGDGCGGGSTTGSKPVCRKYSNAGAIPARRESSWIPIKIWHHYCTQEREEGRKGRGYNRVVAPCRKRTRRGGGGGGRRELAATVPMEDTGTTWQGRNLHET